MEEIIQGVPIPDIFFNSSTLQIKYYNEELSFDWKPANLYIGDSINGGITRGVLIYYFKDDTNTYLKTEEKLEKSEFEQIFKFRCGQFVKGRIISLTNDYLTINN